MGTVNEMRSAGLFKLINNTDIRDKINQLEQNENLDRILLPSITRRAANSMAYVDQNIVVNKEDIAVEFDLLDTLSKHERTF